MTVIKLLILWLSANECLAKIIDISLKTDESVSLAEATVKILSRCYETRVNIVGFAGIPDSFLFEMLWSQQSLSMAVIGNNTYEGPIDRGSRHKLQLFAVIASSSEELEKTLRQIKSSLWWNHMATFLILDWKSAGMEHGCSNAFEFLWTAWKMNLLKAMYLCVHQTRGRLIYSYNPYTSKAPDPWQRGNTYKGKNDHPWTLFLREYGDDERICENLEFDKTNDLAGYEIDASVEDLPPSLRLDFNKTGIDRISGQDADLAKTVLRALNASARLILHDRKQTPGTLDSRGNDIAMDTVDGISDILLINRLLSGVLNYTVSDSYHETGFSIVTQHRGPQSQLQKLLTVLDSDSRIGLCLVIMTIIIFYKFCRRETLGLAILNTLQIIVNSSLKKVPTNQGARIYLATIFFVVVTIVGIYQGLLASLLTKSKPLPDAETIQDLAERNYTIHARKRYADYFRTPVFNGRFVGHESHFVCLDYVLLDSSAACVGSRPFIFEKAVKLKLHTSNDIVYKSSVVYVIREDWPLEETLNKVIGALVQAGVTKRVLDNRWKKADSIQKFNKNLEKNQKCDVMTLSELAFAFAILGIGFASATICFVVEVAIPRLRSRISNLGDSVRNRVKFM